MYVFSCCTNVSLLSSVVYFAGRLPSSASAPTRYLPYPSTLRSTSYPTETTSGGSSAFTYTWIFYTLLLLPITLNVPFLSIDVFISLSYLTNLSTLNPIIFQRLFNTSSSVFLLRIPSEMCHSLLSTPTLSHRSIVKQREK